MNNKDLVTLIKKTAQGLADPPGVDMKTYKPTAPSVAPTSNTDYGPPASSAGPAASPSRYTDTNIQKMQEALITLAQTVVSQVKLQDFITKNYIQNSDVPGVQFGTPTKQPGDPNQLNVVMDSMQRIGNPKTGELKVDGNWGPMTNAALVNVYAMTQGLLKLASDFKLPIRSYNSADLADLKNAVSPDNSLTPAEKKQDAPRVTAHLQAIAKMYIEIKNSILDKPGFRSFIEGDKPFITYQKSDNSFSPQQIATMKQAFPNGFTISMGDQDTKEQITIDDMLNIDSLKKWIAKFPNVKLDPVSVLAQVDRDISQNKGA